MRSKSERRDPADVVTAVLQRYADRGVFRGFSVAHGLRGRLEYRFTWLIRRPIALAFDPRKGRLNFPNLLPEARAQSGMVADLQTLVAAVASRKRPAHKRLDGRRATAVSSLRAGGWSLTLAVRGANHEYAMRAALNLVNEIFLLLRERYPDYLTEQFGLSGE